MKMLVISDTHGCIVEARKLLENIKGIDLLVHLGDFEIDGLQLAEEFGIKAICVAGNMDGSYKGDYKYLDLECGRVMFTHGHVEKVAYGSEKKLEEKCLKEGCIATFFGHTHLAFYEKTKAGIILLNPGSISQPRSGQPCSYAVVTSDQQGIRAAILYVGQGRGCSKKPQGGNLRSMINYSDRF